jgi:hypothetical protein
MSLTKKQLIDALVNLDVPDDTLVVKETGIGFEDVFDVKVQNIVSALKENDEFPAIILN